MSMVKASSPKAIVQQIKRRASWLRNRSEAVPVTTAAVAFPFAEASDDVATNWDDLLPAAVPVLDANLHIRAPARAAPPERLMASEAACPVQ